MKKIFLISLSLLILNLLNAQTTYGTSSYYGKMNYIYAHVDKSAIPTGLLLDYGIDFMEVSNTWKALDFTKTEPP